MLHDSVREESHVDGVGLWERFAIQVCVQERRGETSEPNIYLNLYSPPLPLPLYT